jgi:hypothetical protein
MACFDFITALPQPQPNSTSTQVGVDKVISWTTTTTPHEGDLKQNKMEDDLKKKWKNQVYFYCLIVL